MPAERPDFLNDVEIDVFRFRIDETLDEIEPDPAHTGGVHRAKLIDGYVRRNIGDATRPITRSVQRIDDCSVVLAVAGRLNDYVPGKAEKVPEREQLVFSRIAGRVLAFRRIRKLHSRTEHMAMRIDRTRGQSKLRFAWVRVERNPTCIRLDSALIRLFGLDTTLLSQPHTAYRRRRYRACLILTGLYRAHGCFAPP